MTLNQVMTPRLKHEIIYNLEKISAVGTYPVHILLIILTFKTSQYYESLVLFKSFILMYGFGFILRKSLFRKRINPENKEEYLSKKFSSFPSFHVTRMTIFSLVLINFFDYQIDVIIFSVLLTLTIALARVLNKHHYVSDVVGAVPFGIIIFTMSS